MFSRLYMNEKARICFKCHMNGIAERLFPGVDFVQGTDVWCWELLMTALS